MTLQRIVFANLFASMFVVVTLAGQSAQLGYSDTPMLPGGKWHVHDGMRPQPTIVTPGPAGEPVPAPADAVVLFDGRDLSKWQTPDGKLAGWRVVNGAMVVQPMSGDVVSKDTFGDVQLHVEWATPDKPEGNGQERGNSGVFLMERYEVQVLDSFKNQTYPDGQAGAIYGQFPPLVNASRGPGVWQTYDIVFIAPRFADGKLVSPARATVFHNNVLVQHDVTLIGQTVHRALGTYEPHADRLPIKLQDHGNPTKFRNIWARRLQ